MSLNPLSIIAVAFALVAATILIIFLVKRPVLDLSGKVLLFFGLGVFPIGAAATVNVRGFERTTERTFCGSCHVMTPHANDSADPKSFGLASRHARNHHTGSQNCYTCHADYGMYGTVLTKMGGMRHVWLYYSEFRDMPLPEAASKIHLLKPYPNRNCMECHSTELQGWLNIAEHRSSLEDVRANRVSCASAGCHGFAHPTTKPATLVRAPPMRESGHGFLPPADAGSAP